MPIDSDAFRDSIENSSLLKVDLVDMSQSVELYNSDSRIAQSQFVQLHHGNKTAGKALEEKLTTAGSFKVH